MTKPKLQIREKYFGAFELAEVILPILLGDTSTNDDTIPIMVMPQQKGIEHAIQ